MISKKILHLHRAVDGQADLFRTWGGWYAIFYSCRYFCGGDCTQHFGACKIAADLTVADVTQVEFNDFVAGEAECLGEVLGAIFEALNRLIADSINIAILESSSFSVSKEKREETVDQLSKAVILRFKDRAQNLAQTLGFSSYKIVKLNLGHIGNRQVGGDFAHAKMLRAAPVAEMAAGIEDGVPASPGSEEISLTVSGSVQM